MSRPPDNINLGVQPILTTAPEASLANPRMHFYRALELLTKYRQVDTTHIRTVEDVSREFDGFMEATQSATIGLLALLPDTTTHREHGVSFENTWTAISGKQATLSIGYSPDELKRLQIERMDPDELLLKLSGQIGFELKDPTEDITKRVFLEWLNINPGTQRRNSWYLSFHRQTIFASENFSYDAHSRRHELDYSFAVDPIAKLTGDVAGEKPNPWSRLSEYIVLFAQTILDKVLETSSLPHAQIQTVDDNPRRLAF